MIKSELLQFAIDDNIQWCTAICESHQANIHITNSTWINCNPAPRYYPNIITREPKAQSSTLAAIDQYRIHNPTGSFGIKDSYEDINLEQYGFNCILNGVWYGGYLPTSQQGSLNWQAVQSADELEQWEIAWGGYTESRIFKDILLLDPRIKFWCIRENGNIRAGFISFYSEKSIGVSNWFSTDGSVFELGIAEGIAPYFRSLPIVFWLAENDAINAGTAISSLGSMRVWIAPDA